MKVCVVGAGASGLVAVKELRELGHSVKCFEKRHGVGGVYLAEGDTACVYDSTRLSNSNYFIAFSSFPPKAGEKRRFWHYTEYIDYLKAFCDEFRLGEAIEFSSQVTRVSRRADGRFCVESSCGGVSSTDLYDAVAVCAGTHKLAKLPRLQGSEDFEGEIVHTESYRNAACFAGKRVVCVGMGETAADVLNEVSQVAASCVLSIRHYPHVIARFPHNNEHPSDALTTRAFHMHRKGLQDFVRMSTALRGFRSPLAHNRLKAEWAQKSVSPHSQFVTKTDVHTTAIASGRVQVNSAGIRRLTATTVLFNDGFSVDADVVICCTGYTHDLQLLADVQVTDVRRQLYKHTFHPQLGARLAFIGFVRPDFGGIPAAAELQSRYFALLCSGQRQLPDAARLEQTIAADARADEQRFCLAPDVPTLVSYSHFMDDMAQLIGCQPSIGKLLLNPVLLYHYNFGSQIACHYRLSGPGAEPAKAENVIRRLAIGSKARNIALVFRMNVYLWLFDMLGVNNSEYPTNTTSGGRWLTVRFGAFLLMLAYVLGGVLLVSLAALRFGASLASTVAVAVAVAVYVCSDVFDVANFEKSVLARTKIERHRLSHFRN